MSYLWDFLKRWGLYCFQWGGERLSREDFENWVAVSLAFEFIEEIKIKKGLYLVLNNYKPQDWEIDKINLEESCVHLVNKNGKSSSDIVFKWNMKFIGPWSVLVANDWTWEGVMGSYYQSGLSFNFWYLF